ncbi:MAG: UDP-N-acetylmuramoyl-L-alanyl-D-glutamate--2,6-diaminopimelate ligase [Polyangiaceae bacterium]|nr:UDP-N-acetylmuramoyl-L-alanyl-D-glutamate--2,6-diaminopimelate ligase [Polyangiaceae bacterium]
MSEGDSDAEVTPIEGLRLADLARELSRVNLEGDRSVRNVRVYGVKIDSRRVKKGDLFVARAGKNVDGVAFIPEALARGAVAILIDRNRAANAYAYLVGGGGQRCPVLLADDLPEAMAYAAAAVYGHPAFSLDIVGVTGTNGKTTTTHLVRTAVDGALGGAFCGVIGTVGHSYAGQTIAAEHTTPEADELARVLASMKKRGASHVAMEVSSIALTQKRVSAVRFRVAAFTNLTQDHLDFHGSMDAYANAKRLLFTEMAPGLAVVNISDPFGECLADEARCQVFRVATRLGAPEADHADIAVVRADLDANATHLVVRVLDKRIELTTRLIGAHNVENTLIALGVAQALDLDMERVAAALQEGSGPPGRLERCDSLGDDIVVVVDYAHTPDALVNVLASLRPQRGARPIRVCCVFGCGGDRDPSKRRPMGEVVGKGASVAIITSDNPRTESPEAIALPVEQGVRAAGMRAIASDALGTAKRGYIIELDRKAAIVLAIASACPGDMVLIAGKGHETYQILGTEKRPFDDRVVAREALAARRQRQRKGS